MVKIDSLPKEVKILSSPKWVSISIRQTDKPDIPVVMKKTVEPEPKTDKTVITHNITAIATISVQANDNNLPRTGKVRFSNGALERDLIIKQLGNKVVTNDDIILVGNNTTGEWKPRTPKEIDPDSVSISSGSITNQSNLVIDKLDMTFLPQLKETEEISETSTGGVVMFRTLDGNNITRNYNYGEWLKDYVLIVGPIEGGKVVINDKEYSSTYFESLPKGTSITLTALPDSDKIFKGWSDGVTTEVRQITIIEDIEIYPIFESESSDNNLLYDNGDNILFDNSDLILI